MGPPSSTWRLRGWGRVPCRDYEREREREVYCIDNQLDDSRSVSTTSLVGAHRREREKFYWKSRSEKKGRGGKVFKSFRRFACS
jgi:hypothetical protein